MMEKNSRNMLSLSRYSRSNAVNQEWTEMYLDEAHTKGVLPVRCHCNVIAWAGGMRGVPPYQERYGQPACHDGMHPLANTVDTPVLYWAGFRAMRGDFPAEESFYTFLEQAVCLFAWGDQLQKFAQSVRHPHGGPAERHSGARGHFRPSDETRHHHQPQQILSWDQRQWQVTFSPTIWCVTITSRERISCWWTRATAIRGLCRMIHDAHVAGIASTSRMRRTIRYPSTRSTPIPDSSMWKSARASRL